MFHGYVKKSAGHGVITMGFPQEWTEHQTDFIWLVVQ